MSFWEMHKITVSVNIIGNCWKSGSHWDFGENKNYESFAVYQQYYIKICHNNSKQWKKKKKAQKATKSLKNKCHQMKFFFFHICKSTDTERNKLPSDHMVVWLKVFNFQHIACNFSETGPKCWSFVIRHLYVT